MPGVLAVSSLMPSMYIAGPTTSAMQIVALLEAAIDTKMGWMLGKGRVWTRF